MEFSCENSLTAFKRWLILQKALPQMFHRLLNARLIQSFSEWSMFDHFFNFMHERFNGTKLTCMKYVECMKVCFNMKDISSGIFLARVNMFWKHYQETNFPSLNSRTCFCCHMKSYKLMIFLPNGQNFCAGSVKFIWNDFYYYPICVIMCKLDFSISKQKSCHGSINS